MDYSQLSDFEINCLVAEATGHKPLSAEQGYEGLQEKDDITAAIVRGPRKLGAFDPCNNPADAWPIIDENDITVINDLPSRRCAVMSASAFFNGAKGWEVRAYDANGMRAAMIVFLLMQDAQHA